MFLDAFAEIHSGFFRVPFFGILTTDKICHCRFLSVFFARFYIYGGFIMIENIIFSIMVVIAVGAGIFTCIYEVGGSSNASSEEPSQTEPQNAQGK